MFVLDFHDFLQLNHHNIAVIAEILSSAGGKELEAPNTTL